MGLLKKNRSTIIHCLPRKTILNQALWCIFVLLSSLIPNSQPVSPVRRFQRLIAGISVVLFGAKVGAWVLTHSVTILTDALESTVNVVAAFVGLYSLRVAAKPRDADHPYGHAKAEFISALFEGMLVFVAGILVLWSAAAQLFRPHPILSLDIGIAVVAGAGLVNGLAGIYALRTGKRNRSAVLLSAGRHLLSDAYSSAGAVAGLFLLRATGWRWVDSAVAALFGFVILWTGYKVLRHSFSGIMDETDEPLLKEILSLLEAHRRPNWIDLHNLRLVRYGETVHLDAHMTLPWYHLVRDADLEIQKMEALVQSRFGSTAELFIHIDGCEPYQCYLCTMPECAVRQEAFKEKVVWTTESVWANAKHGKKYEL